MGLFGKSKEEKAAIEALKNEQKLEEEQKLQNEKEEKLRADEEQKKIDELMNQVLMSTTTQLDGYKILEYKGTVQSLVMSELADLDWSEILSSSTSQNSLNKAFNEVQENLQKQLKESCIKKDGNAIIGISYDTEVMETNTGREDILTSLPIIDKKMLLSGFGTVVTIEKI